ncbi:MAG: zinc-dependent metalloprotease [Betaproteobacteria bacterium]
MKPIIVGLLGLLLWINTGNLFAQTGDEAVSCNSLAGRSASTQTGLFTVHQRCGHVLYEIPTIMLDRVMLINTEFAALKVREGDAQTAGKFADTRLVRWVRRGDQIHLELVQYDIRVDGGPGPAHASGQVSPGVLIRSFDVLSEGTDGAPVIDVTKFFFADLPTGFALEFRRRFRMVQVDPQRSYIDSVKVFPQNIEMKFSQTWTANPEDLAKQPEAGENLIPASMGFLFQASMLLLPEQPMQGRYADARVGYYSAPFNEYGSSRTGAVRRAFIQRYRLEKKDPSAALSDAVKPIVFYVGREVPVRWRPYIKLGVEDWQVVFEKAGFRNAIIAKDAPTEQEDASWDPDDARYSAIRWAPGQNAVGWGLADPRSGEVICSHATLWYTVLNELESFYFVQVAPLDVRAQRLPLPDEVIGQLLRYAVSHEIGHALGLRHNFKAHSSYSVAQLRSREWTERWGTSASIMSYARFNYVAQPGDHAYLLPRFGPYDYFAVEWGYKPLPGLSSDQEWDALDRLAARQLDEPMLRFGGEDEAAEVDPTVMTGVVGDDPIAASDLGLRNLDRVATMLVAAATEKGRDYVRLAELYAALVAQQHHELSAVAKLIGGVIETRNQAKRGAAPFQPVPAQRQRGAVRFLLDRGFAIPTTLLNPDIVKRIGSRAAADPLRVSNEDLVLRLLDASVFQRMAEGQTATRQAEKYVGANLVRDLNRGLFSELDQAMPVIDLYRRGLQRSYVQVLVGRVSGEEQRTPRIGNELESAIDPDWNLVPSSYSVQHERRMSSPVAGAAKDQRREQNAASEFRAALRAGTEDLASKVKAARKRVKDDETALHLKDLLFELERGR